MGNNHSFYNKRHIFYTERFESHTERFVSKLYTFASGQNNLLMNLRKEVLFMAY